MKCEICNENDATIHIKEIVGGKQKSLHICPTCAAAKNKDEKIFEGLNLAEILFNVSSQLSESALPEGEINHDSKMTSSPHATVSCSICGWNTLKFQETGHLGCANCYEVFRKILEPAFQNMHKGAMHLGKEPGAEAGKSSTRLSMQIMQLQKQLQQCVAREEFEEAAKLRDRINELKNKVSKKTTS